MPIDIALANGTPTGMLELREAQPLPDGSAFAAFLVVRSGAFAAAMPFFFTDAALVALILELDDLSAGRGALATLSARGVENFIAFERALGDVVSVTGELHDPDDDQLLRFRFPTRLPALESVLDGVRQLTAVTLR